MPVKHQKSNDPVYKVWSKMKCRCTNPNNPKYKDYGGRGIRVCDRWLDSFEAFAADLGERPSSDHSIERNDVNGPYSPDNCRWADRLTQQNNRRDNRYLTWNGRTLTLSQWARETGLHKNTLYNRIRRGWSIERTLCTSTSS